MQLATTKRASNWPPFLAASEAQSEVLVSIGRSCGRVDFIVKKGRRLGLRYKCNQKEVTQGWRTPKMVFAHYQ